MYFLNYGYSVLVNTGIFEKGSMCFRQFLQEKTARMSLYNMENSKILDQKKRAERTVEEDVPAMVFYQFLEAASAAFGVVAVLGIMLDYHWAVSYTHLDVYKRQVYSKGILQITEQALLL